ncbi:DNA-binding protein, putative [Rhodovulum sp. PH10]|uniref:helix-turn-helix domain-containing protein n=1 Tax=Rhodovulum sp. PH10 TaxID=1187851 RepID=UPI00027C23BF|nr:helix-turn-helix transcriptional regulator [Rhodovulum sp. PH10]EJW10830.1 DNA-binding protein, putative [Rhodovulum sp. PH10]
MPRRQPDALDRLIGRNIRQQRLKRGLSQTELADAIGIRFQQLQKYEKAKNRITASRLYLIARRLDVPFEVMFEG